MVENANADVINGITLLETGAVSGHPRLFFTPAKLAALRGRIDTAPWNGMFAKVRQAADDGNASQQALVYLLAGQGSYLAAAKQGLVALVHDQSWPENPRDDGFVAGPLCQLALAYDWLHNDLDETTCRRAAACLAENSRRHCQAFALHHSYWADTYTCNHTAAIMIALTASALAVYGDADDIGPQIKFIVEKARLMTDALGPDGASQEGICYGGVYIQPYIMMLDLIQSLLGWDFFQDNKFLQNLAQFHAYSLLPRDRIKQHCVHFCFADGVRYNWAGPSMFLRRTASAYNDGLAQWTADLHDEKNVGGSGHAFLNLAWYNPDVVPAPPNALPPFRHFEDKGLVIMRSGWDGDETVSGFLCGPHSGHHALARYQQCIGGGHMAPAAGSFLIFGHGNWLIADGWYSRKFTRYRNTVTVDGVGQTGQGGDWFECLQLRQEQRAPRLLRADHGGELDYLIADVAPAYEREAGLKTFRRHLLYVRPDTWVIVDELETERPARFELFFHAFEECFHTDRPFVPQDKPFVPGTPGQWTVSGENGALTISALAPDNVAGAAELQDIEGLGAHHDRQMDILRLFNAEKVQRTVFVTLLAAHPAGAPAGITARLADSSLVVASESGSRSFKFMPWQAQADTPVLHPV